MYFVVHQLQIITQKVQDDYGRSYCQNKSLPGNLWIDILKRERNERSKRTHLNSIFEDFEEI